MAEVTRWTDDEFLALARQEFERNPPPPNPDRRRFKHWPWPVMGTWHIVYSQGRRHAVLWDSIDSRWALGGYVECPRGGLIELRQRTATILAQQLRRRRISENDLGGASALRDGRGVLGERV